MDHWAAFFSFLGYDDKTGLSYSFKFIAVFLTFVGLSFGCVVTIVIVGADAWRAFKQRKHWIPGDSLVLGAFALQLLLLLNKPSFGFSFNDKTHGNPFQYACEYLDGIHLKWMLVLTGRVSTCVLMGCLLPGVARPLSTNLRTDMAALFISFALVVLHIISYEIAILPTAYKNPGYVAYVLVDYPDYSVYNETYDRCPTDPRSSSFVELANVIVLVSMVTLVLLLGCAALASVGIHEIVSHKIPVILSALKLSPHLYSPKILLEKVEEQVLKSWIVARTSNPQYIISRSILSSSVALVITLCNGVLVFEMARCSYKTISTEQDFHYSNDKTNYSSDWYLNYNEGCIRPPITIPLILHYMVIFLGSAVIYCRCVTAAVYNLRGMDRNLCTVREYWQIEDFWVSHLLDLIDGSKRYRRGIGGESYLTKVIVKFFRSVILHRLLPVIVWLQIFLVFFSKGCCLLSQLLLSNKILRKLVVGSASDELSNLYGLGAPGEIQLERDPAYDMYKKAFITMQGENPAGLWIANRTSILELKKRFGKGEEEGKICNELIALLVDKSSAGFSGQRCMMPDLPLGLELEVESELNVSKRSCKMTAVSILTLIFELSTFTHNEGEPKNVADRAIEACSQAWNIMDVVEYSDSEAAALIKAADELLQKLHKQRKWLDRPLPMTNSADKSWEVVKAAVENLFERGKEIADAYNSRAWEEVAAAYSLCKLCRSININDYNFNSVEGVVDELEGMLADVIASCISKAAQVIAEDCKKWATNLEEERIWKAAKVAGKVKAITEESGLILEATSRSDIDQSASGNGRHVFKRYGKSPAMT